MKKLLLILSLLLVLTACGGQDAPASDMPAEDTPAASDDANGTEDAAGSDDAAETEAEPMTFTAYTLDGGEADESLFANARLTVFNVWATYCNPCINEMPELGELAAEGGTEYQIVGLCSDVLGQTQDEVLQKVAEAQEIVAATEANYVHLAPSESLLPLLYEVTAVPTTYFFDSEGRQVGDPIAGAMNKERWQEEIEARLAQLPADDETPAEDAPAEDAPAEATGGQADA